MKMELTVDGYTRIQKKIQDLEDAAGKGIFDPGSAPRCLREAYGGLRELERTLREVCLLAPDAADPSGPGAA
jgi:hypothetical protein